MIQVLDREEKGNSPEAVVESVPAVCHMVNHPTLHGGCFEWWIFYMFITLIWGTFRASELNLEHLFSVNKDMDSEAEGLRCQGRKGDTDGGADKGRAVKTPSIGEDKLIETVFGVGDRPRHCVLFSIWGGTCVGWVIQVEFQISPYQGFGCFGKVPDGKGPFACADDVVGDPLCHISLQSLKGHCPG